MKKATRLFVGRSLEIDQLKQGPKSGKAKLIALYGRRRVGKTALIQHAYSEFPIWKFEGLEGIGNKDQLRHFQQTLKSYIQSDKKIETINSWQEAFRALEKALLDLDSNAIQPVLFFDEFQWMAGMRNKVVSIFKWAWDNIFSEMPGLRIILCGSISSFIVKKVLRSKALYGRVDLEMEVKPLEPKDCLRFWERENTPVPNPSEVFPFLFAMGGIPRYLEEIIPSLSTAQNLERLAFKQNSYFSEEYQRLFISHFGTHPIYAKIMSCLARESSFTRIELAKKLKIEGGGSFSTMLEDLCLAGFVEEFVPIGKGAKKSKLQKYRLKDEFVDFHYQFIESNYDSIQNGNFKGLEILTGFRFMQWRGYAFERFVRKHAAKVAECLGFAGVRYQYGSWFDRNSGVQIDLMFERSDGVITLVEAKYGEYAFPKKGELKKKVEWAVMKFKKPVQMVLIIGPTKPENLPEFSNEADRILSADEVFLH